MKNIAAFILLIAVLTQLGSRYLVMLNYEFNKNYIAKTLCINRNEPMSRCNGKCYLKKQLARASKEENPPNSKTCVDKNEVLFLTGIKKMTAYFFVEESSRQYLNRKQPFTSQNLYRAVFHPPKATDFFPRSILFTM